MCVSCMQKPASAVAVTYHKLFLSSVLYHMQHTAQCIQAGFCCIQGCTHNLHVAVLNCDRGYSAARLGAVQSAGLPTSPIGTSLLSQSVWSPASSASHLLTWHNLTCIAGLIQDSSQGLGTTMPFGCALGEEPSCFEDLLQHIKNDDNYWAALYVPGNFSASLAAALGNATDAGAAYQQMTMNYVYAQVMLALLPGPCCPHYDAAHASMASLNRCWRTFQIHSGGCSCKDDYCVKSAALPLRHIICPPVILCDSCYALYVGHAQHCHLSKCYLPSAALRSSPDIILSLAGTKLQCCCYHHQHHEPTHYITITRPGQDVGDFPICHNSGPELLHLANQPCQLQCGACTYLWTEFGILCPVCAAVAGHHIHRVIHVPIWHQDRRGCCSSLP